MLLALPIFALFLTLVVLFLHLNPRKNVSLHHPPPGPKGFPFIGNLHQFDPSKPHVYFANLAKTYGPILSLRFGHVPIVVVQSAKLAKEILQTQDLNFCSRPLMMGMQKLSYNGLDIAFAPYGEYFREVKKLSVVYLLSSRRVESFAHIRQEEVLRMIQKISSLSRSSQIVNLTELLMSFARSNICRTAFGKRYEDDDNLGKRFHKLLNEVEAMFTIVFFGDYFPFLGWLDKLTGKFSKLDKIFKECDAFYEEIINDHLDPNRPKTNEGEDLVDVLLHIKKDRSFHLTKEHIKAVLMNIFVAGTDTSSAMVEWAMTELMQNSNSMKKVQKELRTVAGNKGFLNNADLMELSYFKAVVKETLRLHPAAPLLIVRETIQKSIIEGYDILPKTHVYVNAWAIGRDSNSWKDPEKFFPERFLGTSIDFKGNDFQLIPFGGGRRICPGMLLGHTNMELALANLLYSFDWELPSDLKKTHMNTDTLPGITMHKKHPIRLFAKEFQ
ncbi:5-OH-xanthotoxin synthase-like [Amaranthus tricolor]|uniref:5-OH-xanthotoxin synthase-like n=1 Tax=Amaranthus tricolor TaxID=29722 RepID=UPI00258F1F5D|nr:5-OH-xanthotoxin synthase-like [Amaranthus tricolor]